MKTASRLKNHARGNILHLMASAIGTALTITSLLEPSPASAAFRKTPPTTPGNFHVTAVTDSSVSFAWTASKAGSDANFNYVLVNATTGFTSTLSKGTTSYTDTLVTGGQTYSFYIYAVDLLNNKSANSPTVTVTLPAPPPPPPPAAPILSLVSVTPSTITVAWPEINFEDDYLLFVDGVLASDQNLEFDDFTEWTVINLAPGTTHTITVEAIGAGGDSPMSNPVTATTTTTTDPTPPTTPTGLTGASDGGGEAIVSWNPSTDNVTPQSQIEYRFYVNGLFEPDATVIGQTSNVYVFPNPPGSGGIEQIYVVAVDQAGNVSAPSNVLTVDF